MGRPIRSLTEQPGLNCSILAYSRHERPRATRFSRTSGVRPIVVRMLSWTFLRRSALRLPITGASTAEPTMESTHGQGDVLRRARRLRYNQVDPWVLPKSESRFFAAECCR